MSLDKTGFEFAMSWGMQQDLYLSRLGGECNSTGKSFFHVIIHVVLQNYVAKTHNCCINMLLLCTADIIGTYKDFLNLKGTRNKDFEALHFVWQVVPKCSLAKSQEIPN